VGVRFKHWKARSTVTPQHFPALVDLIYGNRQFVTIPSLAYGDYGLEQIISTVKSAIENNKRIALYADYDVDGTMSCVSWIWFLRSIGYHNFIHYIPNRFSEGYGVNLKAVQYLATQQKAEVIITMDTGITANVEAEWCRHHGVDFICTDHHVIQPEKMPDCLILNPKLHPDPLYQELCGCGITFVLLRQLGKYFSPPDSVWQDILALTGMATICDVVPLNGVNHKLAQHGVQALMKSKRPILQELLRAASLGKGDLDEKDIGFRLGPRINAVGRLEHADKVIQAFLNDDPRELVGFMHMCNEKRKSIQAKIVDEARKAAERYPDDPILFLGGDWHQGVVGIAASKIAEEFWKPVWLFRRQADRCTGSARSIPEFNVTEAMGRASQYLEKFGGHHAAGGFSFKPENEDAIREALNTYAVEQRQRYPQRWESTISYDCALPLDLIDLALAEHLQSLRPFGNSFAEPVFCLDLEIDQCNIYHDKQTGNPKHTAVHFKDGRGRTQKIMFFNAVYAELQRGQQGRFLVTAGKNTWQGTTSLSLMGCDFNLEV
jgi:single-stranded-DNA-specific exonuclease